jgi:hypothetical protein
MAIEKTPADTAAPAPAATTIESFDLTLEEFCRRLSSKITAPELIGGFNHSQIAAGKIKGSEASFAAAFDAFSKQPA